MSVSLNEDCDQLKSIFFVIFVLKDKNIHHKHRHPDYNPSIIYTAYIYSIFVSLNLCK